MTWNLHRIQGACILKLTLPDEANKYLELVNFEGNKVERLVGLSGGYSLEQACIRLSVNRHMQASFSRALAEGLYYADSDPYFETQISSNISNIVEASKRG